MTARLQRRCPSSIELERSFWARDGACDLHRKTCGDCEVAWLEIEELAELGAGMPGPVVSSDRLEQLRTAVLASTEQASPPAATARSSRRRAIAIAGFAAVGVAAGAVLVAATRDREPLAVRVESVQAVESVEQAPVRRASAVAVASGSTYSLDGAQPDEVVRLTSGSIEVKVATLGPGERFRVLTSDAEVEVRGTVFRVTAHDGRLTSVVVREGLVVVRSAGAERALRAGERWERVASRTDTDETDVLGQKNARPSPPRPKRPVKREQKIEVPAPPEASMPRAPSAYEAGWSHLRSKRYAKAAAAFEKAIASSTGASKADALYWASVSQFRASRKERARVLLRQFLRDQPGDRRRAEVSVMLGWIEVDRRDFATARRLFSAGLKSRSKKVRASAQAGLEALSSKSKQK